MTRDEAHRTPIPTTGEEIAAYHRIGELPPPSCLVAPDLRDGSPRAGRDGCAAAASDVSRVDRALQARQFAPVPSRVLARDEPCADPANCDIHTTRQLPAVPPWVQNPEKWVTLSRAARRQLERHHRKAGGAP
jgi:hypothetical protein